MLEELSVKIYKIARKVRRFFLGTNPKPEPKPQWGTVLSGPCSGVRLYVSDAWKDMLSGTYDKFLYDALEEMEIDLSGAVVWDVGAHVGYHSLAMAKMVGVNGFVLAFEPNPYNAQRLTINLQANQELEQHIRILEEALSEKEGLHSMQISSKVDKGSSSGSYLDTGKRPSDRYTEKVYEGFISYEVSISTADAIYNREQYPPPRFIKVDIEGAEISFLRGAHNLLTTHKPVLAIELHNIQCMFHAHQILHDYGYRLYLLDDGVNESSRCFVIATFEHHLNI